MKLVRNILLVAAGLGLAMSAMAASKNTLVIQSDNGHGIGDGYTVTYSDHQPVDAGKVEKTKHSIALKEQGAKSEYVVTLFNPKADTQNFCKFQFDLVKGEIQNLQPTYIYPGADCQASMSGLHQVVIEGYQPR